VSPLLVTDTTCLIALDRVGLLGLLPRLHDVVAPPAVIAEFGRRPPWLREEPVADRRSVAALLAQRLDAGEAEAITLARAMPDAVLLIDEVRGRRIALSLGLSIIGTAGFLATARMQGSSLPSNPSSTPCATSTTSA
jgi:predicted nucleic acid-binding protein